jgi:hypothetical protein
MIIGMDLNSKDPRRALIRHAKLKQAPAGTAGYSN